ncbi:MAG: T9SS type A sorting domain-containing protein [Chitinophagales bacterium]
MQKTTTFLLPLLLSSLIFAQTEYTMQNATVADCSGILYDSGGPDADYNPNEKLVFTICPDPVPTCMQIDFGTVMMESNFDLLEVFDGSSTTSPQLLFHNTGLQTLPILNAYNGCITVRFRSDTDTQLTGWKATWNCFEEDCPIPIIRPNEQDCEGAIVVCQEVYSNLNPYYGEGHIPNEIDGQNTCLLSGEKNSVWYKLKAEDFGELAFSIIPYNLTDDYDWAVFNVTNNTCGEIYDNPSLLISCNYSSTAGITGPTGETNQTSALGEDKNQNKKITVKKGWVYAINISQFTTSPNGFILDFSASTIPIGDEVASIIEDKNVFLKGTEPDLLQLNFSEEVQCQTIEALNLSIEGYELTNETLCNETGYAQTFYYRIEPELPIGEYVLLLEGEIADVCGNTDTFSESFDLQIADLTDIEDALQNPIRFYPNPSQQTIFVELPISFNGNTHIEVYSVEGKILQNSKLENKKTVEIDVSHYPRGIYYLKVKVGASVWTEKVVVQ